jgi:hypothetical protein
MSDIHYEKSSEEDVPITKNKAHLNRFVFQHLPLKEEDKAKCPRKCVIEEIHNAQNGSS